MARPERARATRCLEAKNRFAEPRIRSSLSGTLKGVQTTLLHLENLLNSIGSNRVKDMFYFDP